MNPSLIAFVVFACAFGGALVGMLLRRRLPLDHLSDESRDTVKLCIGLVATMTALILGLITASAKSSFDAVTAAVKHAAADVLDLDHTLARYGPETAAARVALKHTMAIRIERTWPADSSRRAEFELPDTEKEFDATGTSIRRLSPQNEEQRWLQSRALSLSESVFQTRELVLAGLGTSIPKPFLAMLVFWLTITFACFGLCAPPNATVVTVLLLCALSVAGAVFLVTEMDGPFQGLIKVSDEPLKYTLQRLNQ